jgi:hypothetical protein
MQASCNKPTSDITILKNKVERKKLIALCTPTRGDVSIYWAQAVRAIDWPANIGYVPFFCVDDSPAGTRQAVAEARNRIVKNGLEWAEKYQLDVEYFFWLDDDVIPSAKALIALYNHRTMMASGVYFLRADPPTPLIFPSRSGGTLPYIPNKVYPGIWGGSHGLSLINAEVYRHMSDELPLGVDSHGCPAWYVAPEGKGPCLDDHGGRMMDKGGTEDLFFFENASKLGYTVTVDCSRYTFGWHFDREEKTGYPRKQWGQLQRQEPIVFDTPDGPKSWAV